MSYLIRPNHPANGHSLANLQENWPPYTAVSSGLDTEPESMGASDLLEALRASWGVLLLCAISGIILALVIGWAQAPVYRAQASLEIQGFSSNVSGREPMPPKHENITESYIQTQLKILHSETLLQRVAEKLRLAERSEFTAASKGRRRGSVADGPVPASVREQVTKKLERNLAIRVSGQADVIDVSYESPDPQLATDIVNTLVDE